MRWYQPVKPKILQKEIKIEYYHNHKNHIDNDRKIHIENEKTNLYIKYHITTNTTLKNTY